MTTMTHTHVRLLLTGLLIAAFLMSAASAFAVIVHDAEVQAGGTVSIPVEIDEVPVNLWFYQVTLTNPDPPLWEFISAAFPPWVTLTESSALPADTLMLKAGSLTSPIPAG
ncbi:MAG: hypothetical protein LUO96_05940, partial [Methanomicrobiales archaeon]|nr:hypothetical protein [Methanomicrobiales archaeon]